MQSIHRFQGRSSVYTWLHAILLNLARHYHRDRRRLVYAEELTDQEAPVPETESIQSAQLDAGLASSVLPDALRRLSHAHREVVILRYYEGLKLHEIAARLGISRGTVKSRLHYAIAELQKTLPRELNLLETFGTKL
jgi:RNA polymerase sigma-70 factor (ECF subfamily)